jgi:glutathione synthase/RimK-type ligase-like ATP-grasp enzyme
MDEQQTSPSLTGMAPLMWRAFAGEDLVPVGESLLARAAGNPLDAEALLDFSTVLQLTGHREQGLAVQREAIQLQALYQIPARHTTGVRLLVIMGPGDFMANTPIEFLLEGADVALDLLYLTADGEWPEQVPDHDVLMVAVGESDDNQPLLSRLDALLQAWPRPVVNRPGRIAGLSRDGAWAALHGITGVEIPNAVRVSQDALRTLATQDGSVRTLLTDGDFPIIVRPVGSHAGTGLEKLEAKSAIPGYLNRIAAQTYYLARFVDYRGLDGLYAKYRIVLIDGKPFICHFALSQHWMIHYLNAGMTESAAKRAAEAECMAEFDHGFAQRHAMALNAIHQRIGLDYLGMDCAETPGGELLVFEVDNAMIVHDMDPVDMFPYKKPAMKKVFDAFRQMLGRRVATTP